jgi:hypothetical protein
MAHGQGFFDRTITETLQQTQGWIFLKLQKIVISEETIISNVHLM